MKYDAKITSSGPGESDSRSDNQHKTAISGEYDNADIKLEISDILDALPFYVVLVDEKHHILKANRAVQDQLGVKPEAIIGKYCPEVIHGLKEPWYACPLEEAAETGKAVEKEAIDSKSGRWIRSAIYPISRLSPDGRKVFFHMVSDITDRKEAEKQAENAHIALKSYAAHIVNSQEEERKRIARELHDDTIQSLAVLYRKLDSISAGAPLSYPVNEGLCEAREISAGIVKGLRALVKAIRPPVLDDLGIVASIRRLIMDFTERTKVEGMVKISGGERRLPPEAEICMYRIAQESLRNIEQHSKATKVIVTISFAECQAGLDITDNGVGFDIPASLTGLSAGGHLGLLGMQERAELAGGKIEVQSNPGKGTMISIIIPILQGQE